MASLEKKTKVCLIGVGGQIGRGATCSGKTTLAKHLRNILPGSFIIHQDDFAPPEELIPIHPVLKVQDWDDAPGAIDWERFAHFLGEVKSLGRLPDHRSHDHLNEQRPVPISSETTTRWKTRFAQIARDHDARGESIVWALVDGFLLYWNDEVIKSIDVPVFLRVRAATLERRRQERSGYHTAEGSFWVDPPQYWENIVYPAYVRAHEAMFADGDVEQGESSGKIDGLVLVDGEELDMEGIVDRVCRAIAGAVE